MIKKRFLAGAMALAMSMMMITGMEAVIRGQL